MKLNKIFQIGWRILIAGIFILSLGQTTPVRAAPGVDFSIDKNNVGGNFTQGEQGRTYTIDVENLGDDASSGTVTVTDTPGSGLTVTAISGTGWNCTLGTLTCTRSDSLQSGFAYEPITVTVNVAVDAPNPVFNTATVSYVGDTDDINDVDTDPTAVTQKSDLIILDYELVNTSGVEITSSELVPNQPFGIKVIVKNQGGADTDGVFYNSVFVNRNVNMPPFTITSPEGCLFNTAENENDWGDYQKQNFINSLPAGATDTNTIVDISGGLPAGSYQIWLYADPLCIDRNESNELNNSYGPINLSIGSSPCTIPTGNPPVFADVPNGYWAKDYIEAMYYCGYTAGCSTGSPLLFCPETILNRGQSAVFLLRGNFGTSYTPPSAPWNTFQDDFSPGPWAQSWVQGLYNAGMTAGCSSNPMLYCPWQEATREQLAVFGLRLKYGTSYFPPNATGSVFADMPDPNYWANRWTEKAYADGLILSCGSQGGLPLFCPSSLVSRASASYTIVKAKNLLP